MTATRQLGLFSMLGLWAVLTLIGVLYAVWLGFGGPAFAATLTTFAFLFLITLLFAARGVESALAAHFGASAGILLCAALFLLYLIYALGTNSFSFGRATTAAVLVFAPLALAASAERKPPGCWQDFAIIVGIWLAVKPLPSLWGFTMSHWLFPFPEQLSYVMTVLLCLNVALAVFVLVRRLNGIGYSIGWNRQWIFFILVSFFAFALIAIPLGTRMSFIQFEPRWSEWKSLPLTALSILFFTAWPEEFLFRGLLQNTLSRASKSEVAGWWTASVLFGFSHITNLGFPNWRYVVLATIAGVFYGWTWRRTGSIFASAIVHGAVDTTWHFLFHTL
ncbi:MAG TPA: type II CAAX endopeptidase family protein [Candidatus Acidoferrum sp.]|nr:type II CAAX endopeptidase family protein [Candidatus Acidoferrum sp.]